MIFYTAAAILLLTTFYLLWRPWQDPWSKALFAMLSLVLIFLLGLLGFNPKILQDSRTASRKTIFVLSDISSSTGLSAQAAHQKAKNIYQDYNVVTVPFSDKPQSRHRYASHIHSSVARILQRLQKEYRPQKIAGIILTTDGNETDPAQKGRPLKVFSQKYPHHALLLQKNKKNTHHFDKAVYFDQVFRFAPLYQKHKVSFGVSVSQSSINALPVELSLNGKPLGTVNVELEDGQGKGSFDLVLKNPGESMLTASIARDSREQITSNNRDQVKIEGVHSSMRILHISGHPSWDTSFIRRGLQNTPGIDLISFYILRTQGQLHITPESDLSLINFPVRQLFTTELDNFDVVIMNDFPIKTYLSPLYIQNIAEFVQAGGGLVILGGPKSFGSRDMLNSYVAELLPFDKNNTIPFRQKEFSIQKTPALLNSPIRKLFPHLQKSRLSDYHPIKKFLGYPLLTTQQGFPLVLSQNKGKGKIVTVMTNSFWRSIYDGNISARELIQPLLHEALGISAPPLKIHQDRLIFRPYDWDRANQELSARINLPNQKPKSIKPGQSLPLKQKDNSLKARLMWQGHRLAEYTLRRHQGRRANEKAHNPLARRTLKQWSEKGNGSFHATTLDDLDQAMESLSFADPVAVTSLQKEWQSIRRDKKILALVLLLSVALFYLKSRYSREE